MKLISYCNRVIEYSFYALFFLVPLIFSGDTSELFELNKMWLTWGVTVIIGLSWVTKMILQKRIIIQRTPIDIVLLLFLASQIISSIFSLDPHVSWWGYYSRFNGGLLSTITYIFLYYAFVSNFTNFLRKKPDGTQYAIAAITITIITIIAGLIASGFSSSALLLSIFTIAFFIAAWFLRSSVVMNVLFISLLSGFGVALWGFPSHFGADPTCFIFRGNFDTSCWTSAFKPTIRAFSTLGQPAWLAAYMAFLVPVSLAYGIKNKTKMFISLSFYALAVFLYLLLLFSDTRAGYLAFWIANIFFWGAIYFKKLSTKSYFFKTLIIVNILFIVSSFMFGHSLDSIKNYIRPLLPKTATVQTQAASSSAGIITQGITDSGKIRLLVWQGALRAWEHNPLFGTGVETFAFAYYKYKLPAHNLTSEWDYLYNKAHNEYLNYLATTGIFGLGTYLGFLGIFLFTTAKQYVKKERIKTAALKVQPAKPAQENILWIITIGLIAGYLSLLISNFFGFSVVIINLYIFLVPAFVFIFLEILDPARSLVFPAGTSSSDSKDDINPYQWTAIAIFVFIAGWMILGLIWYRQADIAYALGNNLDKVGQYQQAYPQLIQAVQMEPNEPVYQDELSINLAALSAGLYQQKDATQAAQLAQNAIALSNNVVTNHPNDVVYWKDRVRLFYTLSASNTRKEALYLRDAINAINVAKALAPTDAKIAYNQGVLYGQAGDLKQAIAMLKNTIKLKDDYIDAYVALGLFYHEAAIDKNGKIINPSMQQKAIATYTYIIKHLAPTDSEVKKTLEQWRTQ